MLHTDNPVDQALTSRRSVRAFLPTEVPRATIAHLLAVAARAPSGTNTQPWKVYVLTGERKDVLSSKILAAHDDPSLLPPVKEGYAYYPKQWFSPYIERRRKVGWDLYTLLGIARADKDKMHAQHGQNYRFFGAPVGLMFTIDRRLEQGSWLDYGMFLQSLMIAARGHGLATCPQAAFLGFEPIIAAELGFAEHEQLVCGMALGVEDSNALANTLVTERAPVAEFAHFVD